MGGRSVGPFMSKIALNPGPKQARRSAGVVPSAPPVLTGDETLDVLVARHPGLRSMLMSHGLCTCCGGSLSLRANAAAHGIALSELLEDLERELANGA